MFADAFTRFFDGFRPSTTTHCTLFAPKTWLRSASKGLVGGAPKFGARDMLRARPSCGFHDAKTWAVEAERQIDRGETPWDSRVARITTFAELIDLHVADMKSVGKTPRRSRAATLKIFKARLGRQKLVQLDRQLFIEFCKARASLWPPTSNCALLG